MRLFRDIKCVTFSELVRCENPILSKPNYDKHVRLKKLLILQRGGNGREVLIDYNTLPWKIKSAYDEKYPNAESEIKEQLMSDRISLDSKARLFYSLHLLADDRHIPDEIQHEYVLNASVFNEMIKKENETKACHNKLGGNRRSIVWEIVLGTCEKLREQYKHTLPTNPVRLREKFNQYKKNSYEVLISKKFCNENTLKITEKAGKLIIALKRCRVPVYTNQQLFDEYNRQAEKLGFKMLKSIQSMLAYLNRPEIEPLWYDAVHGELAARQRYTRKHKTKLPPMRDSLWYSDGTKLNLYYKDYDAKGRLIVKTTYVYEVIDAYSEMLLGYHISDTENYEAQYNAFRMAVNRAGCKPYEVVNDNQGGHRKLESEEFFNKIARVSRRTAPYSGQSKTIESVFGRFQQTILHKEWNFTGQNITAKGKESRPNIEFIEANKAYLPTLIELKKKYAEARKEWNCSAHPSTGISRVAMYNNSVNPETEKITMLDMIDMFWLTTQKESTFTSSGITISVNKKKYTYEVLDADGMPDMEFRRKNTLRKFFVMYDPCDMTIVRLYEKDKTGLRYVADAQPYIEVHRDIQGQKEGDMAFIRQMDIKNKEERILRRVAAQEIENEHGVSPEHFGLNTPKLKGLNNKDIERSAQKKKQKRDTNTTMIDIGLYEKELSNTIEDINIYSKY